MAKKAQKKTNKRAPAKPSEPRVKDFLDLIAPTAVKFNTDHYICGGTYRCTLALRSYPASTEELALLRRLGEKSGVTLHIYNRKVSVAEEDKIIHNAENKNKLDRGSTSSMKQAVTAEANLQDVAALIASMRKNSEPLIHCAVFIELSARDPDSLRALRDEVTSELIRSKLGADRLLLRQREGFLSSNPAGRNTFGSQFERVLPAKSVANLYPFNYSGRRTPTASTLAGTGTAPTSSWIWTAAPMTRPQPTSSSWATAARARATCSSSCCATFWKAASPPSAWTRSMSLWTSAPTWAGASST